MNASSPQQMPVEPIDDYQDDFELPPRPRARFLTPLTAALMALLLGGVGFYVGIRVEKSKAASGGAASAFARAFSGARGAGSAGGTAGTSGSRPSGSGGGGFGGRFAGGFGGGPGGGATIGQVSSVSGNTIYVTTTSGNTVKVKLSKVTTISKSESVAKKKLFPGDEIVVQGASNSKGTVAATSVTDSGARAGAGSSATGNRSAGGAGSGGGAGSAIRSLFGNAGG